MAEPFLSEIRLMSFVFAPKGWALCNGQLLPINPHQALFSLLGTTFGGDGRVNFALPDLRGRTPIHVGGDTGRTLGQQGGSGRIRCPLQSCLSTSTQPWLRPPTRTNLSQAFWPVPTTCGRLRRT